MALTNAFAKAYEAPVSSGVPGTAQTGRPLLTDTIVSGVCARSLVRHLSTVPEFMCDAQGMISDHETGSYHCCPLDLSESGSFSSSYVFCDLRKKIVPPPSAGGRDVVGLVASPSNVGQTILREWSDRDGESQG